MTTAAELARDVCRGFAPPPKLTVSQFADQELKVTNGPLAGANWRTDYAPFQRGILDAFHEPGVEIVVIMGSSQWGKTATATNVVAYHIAHDPCDILVVEPTVDPMAKEFARKRLDTLIEASPILRRSVATKRARGAANTTLEKTFIGGSIGIVGANSAASLASRSIRLLVLDEIDRYKADVQGEGSTIQVAIKRTTAFGRRRRIMMLSSPKYEDGPIHSWFRRGDQRYFHVPCPDCGLMHRLLWANVDFENRDPRTARLLCPECGYAIDDVERKAILQYGEWIAENPERDESEIVSMHLSELYSVTSSLEKVVSMFLKAHEKLETGDFLDMQAWENTSLGEPYAIDAGPKFEGDLLERCEDYGEGVAIPDGACLLTMGVDTQDDRLECLVVGWGPDEESWLVDHRVLEGDPAELLVWDKLDDLLALEYAHATGAHLSIEATSIDSGGHRTDNVYDYCLARRGRNVFATKGQAGEDKPIIGALSRPRRRRHKGRNVELHWVGVDQAKELFMKRLAKPVGDRGCVHIPIADWVDHELVEQLTSEVQVKRFHKGVPRKEWKVVRRRNEALDCMVLAIHAMRKMIHSNDEFLLRLRKLTTSRQPARKKPVEKESFIPRREGWLRRK